MRDWLTARPIAHRGLHDAGSGIIENSPSAFRAAIAAGYGIECDLQISADGEAMVHHDDALGRLTDGAGRLDAMTAAALRRTVSVSRQATHSTGWFDPGGMPYAPLVIDRPNSKE